jgi:S-adenosylmethionine synthetase
MAKQSLFTSESATEGHPDRLCDTISDALVDQFLKQDPYSRVVAESAISKGVVFVAALFASKATLDIAQVARSVIAGVGYRRQDFDTADCTVVTSLITMPAEQRIQADENDMAAAELDAYTVHNQTTLFGYACTHTPELMPLPVTLAGRVAKALTLARKEGRMPYLSPDCTTQVGVAFENRKPARIHSVTVIAGLEGPQTPDAADIRADLQKEVISRIFADDPVKPDRDTEIFVNPRGLFPKSGPMSHSGMTGRKTAAETYGCYARHSASALSGKDPSRIDRVGAYAARHAAKNVVAAGLADECEVQLSYSLGHAEPISIQVQTFGTGKVAEGVIQERLEAVFDFRLGAIIREFGLRHLPATSKSGFYRKLAVHGQLGKSFGELPWESTDRAERLR